MWAGLGALTVIGGTSAIGWWTSDPVAIAIEADPRLVRDVTQLTAVQMARVITPKTTEEIAEALRTTTGPVSIGGGRFSMGGQTATTGGIQLDLRQLRGVLAIDTVLRTVTVRAGTTWREVQEAIDPLGFAVQVMQTYNSFTVGGALSVNAHGRYIGHGPVSSTVRSLRLVLASGEIVTASRTERPELFRAALGGYGAVGVIAEATLSLARNVRVRREDQVMPMASYVAWFREHVRNDSTVVFHNADFAPGAPEEVRAVTYRETTAPLTDTARIRPRDQSGWVRPTALEVFSRPGWGVWTRQQIIEPLAYRLGGRNPVTWRNFEASYDVSELEPSSRAHDTYVLQEYFIPVERATAFAGAMSRVLRDSSVRSVNVSIRHANAEPEPLLTWAPTETFAFVLYYRQETTSEAQRAVGRWTRALIDVALAYGGSYYLPYQPHATHAQFRAAYPRSDSLFAVKRAVDPTGRFTNVLWDLYAPDPSGALPAVSGTRLPSHLPAEVRLAADVLPSVHRTEASTWTTHPEWDLVYSSEQYAAWLAAGRRPSAFPYAATIGTFWRSYLGTWRWTRERAEFGGRTHLMLAVIGTSTALEYGLKALYENSVGRVTEWLAPEGTTPEERVAARVNADYARFIAIRPWYEFDYAGALRALAAAGDAPGAGRVRRAERYAILWLEFQAKRAYATLIGGGTQVAYDADEETRWLLVAGGSPGATPPRTDSVVTLPRGYRALRVPRYAGVLTALRALAADSVPVRLVEIAGNGRVAVTGTAPLGWRPAAAAAPILAYRVPTDPARMRVLVDVPVLELVQFLRVEESRPDGLGIDHLYDY